MLGMSSPLVKNSICQQVGCTNLRGAANYTVIGASLSYAEDRTDCRIKPSANASLDLPAGVKVVKAVLYWSASDKEPLVPSVLFNGKNITASKKYHHNEEFGIYRLSFYGAEADVTEHVRTSGLYTVGGLTVSENFPMCFFNSFYAAWTLVVVYEKEGLPVAQVNVCTDFFEYTYIGGTYGSRVQCLAGSEKTSTARTTVVAFEGDEYKGERFYMNGMLFGEDLFRGTSGPNFDIMDFNVTALARKGAKELNYAFETSLTDTVWGPATEGLFFPVRVSYTSV